MQEIIIAYLQKTAAFSIYKSIWDLQMKCLGDYAPYDFALLGMV